MNALEAIKHVPYFADLPERDAVDLAAQARTFIVNKGEFVFHAGEPAEGLYYLISGRARAVRYSADGRELIIKEFRPGDTFNEVGALSQTKNPSSCLALENATRILVVPAQPLRHVLEQHPEVGYRIVRAMAAKLQFAMGKLNRLAFMDVKSRLAAHLLDSMDQEGVLEGISHEGLAAHLGTVRQVVGRALAELQGRGAVRVDRGRIEVLSPDLLRQYAHGDRR